MRVTEWSATGSVLSAGELWGISGPVFLLLYIPVAISAVGIGFWLRHRMIHAPALAPVGESTAPELGLLNSEYRAVMASVALLRGHDLLDGRGLRTGSTTTVALDPFTRKVAAHLDGGPQSIAGLTHQVRADLDGMGRSLVERGYLADRNFTKELREAGLPIVVVGVFGVVRFVAGLLDGNSVIFLGIVLLLLVLLWSRVVAAVRVTPAGRVALQESATANRFLRPANSPSYETYGPAAAGLAVALFGVHALVLLDPGLNTAMSGYGVESAAGASADGGSSAGTDGGGCGGGGGGGGGCGGGCGGCGG